MSDVVLISFEVVDPPPLSHVLRSSEDPDDYRAPIDEGGGEDRDRTGTDGGRRGGRTGSTESTAGSVYDAAPPPHSVRRSRSLIAELEHLQAQIERLSNRNDELERRVRALESA